MSNKLNKSFRDAVRGLEQPLFGTFIKTPSVHSTEIVGSIGFDFVIIDAEHAPFDRGSVDQLLLASRAARIPALVRVPTSEPLHILAALDDGAAGVVAPHIISAQKASQLVAACRYKFSRGFSNSPRAGDYGARSMWDHVDSSDNEVTVVAMIEDPEAVNEIDAILKLDDLDAVFIGRGDLTVALDERSPKAPTVRAATLRVIEAARLARKAVFMLVSSPAEAAEFRALGVVGFVISSDQGFLRAGATQALKSFSESMSNPHAE